MHIFCFENQAVLRAQLCIYINNNSVIIFLYVIIFMIINVSG
jgi:hypothetical protein